MTNKNSKCKCHCEPEQSEGVAISDLRMVEIASFRPIRPGAGLAGAGLSALRSE